MTELTDKVKDLIEKTKPGDVIKLELIGNVCFRRDAGFSLARQITREVQISIIKDPSFNTNGKAAVFGSVSGYDLKEQRLRLTSASAGKDPNRIYYIIPFELIYDYSLLQKANS